jgi:rod shape-determining protein MreB
MIGAVKRGLEEAPAELATDIANNGIVLTGGGALLGNLSRRLTNEIGLDVRVADEPLTCAVRGAGTAATAGLLDEFAYE